MRGARVITRRLRTWLGLGLREKVELVGLAFLAAVAEAAVKLVPLPRLTKTLGIDLIDVGERPAETPGHAPPTLRDDEIARRARAVDRLYHAWPRKSSCLRRALLLGYRIRKAHPVLFIGVAKKDGAIRAHAWIEVDGAVVGEDTGEYAPLRAHKTAG